MEAKINLQERAKEALIQNNLIGTVVLPTGSGKSKIVLDLIKQFDIKDVLVVVPRKLLVKNWEKEIEKFYPELKERIEIDTIQSKYKLEIKKDLLILDEIHKIGEKYSLILSNNCKKIGLTGTPDEENEFKKEVLYKEVPIIFREETKNIEKKVINKTNVIVLKYDLTDTPFKIKNINTTEKKQYQYLENYIEEIKKEIKNNYKNEVYSRIDRTIETFSNGILKLPDEEINFIKNLKALDLDTLLAVINNALNDQTISKSLQYRLRAIKGVNISSLGIKAINLLKNPTIDTNTKILLGKYIWAIKKRKEMLWMLTSSKVIANYLKRKLLESQNNKVLLFSELTSKANELSPYRVHSKVGDNIKKSKEINNELIEKFNNGEIREIASCLSMTLGLNLVGANNAIIESYSSSNVNFVQKKGRLHRLLVNEEATIYVIVPKNTQAEVWFEKMIAGIPYKEIYINNENYKEKIDELMGIAPTVL